MDLQAALFQAGGWLAGRLRWLAAPCQAVLARTATQQAFKADFRKNQGDPVHTSKGRCRPQRVNVLPLPGMHGSNHMVAFLHSHLSSGPVASYRCLMHLPQDTTSHAYQPQQVNKPTARDSSMEHSAKWQSLTPETVRFHATMPPFAVT